MTIEMRKISLSLLACISALALHGQEPSVSDDFSSAKINSRFWEPSFKKGPSRLKPADGKLDFVVPTESAATFAYLYMRKESFYFGKDWSVEVDASNDILPMRSGQLGSIGIEVYDANNLARRLSLALSVSKIAGAYSRVVYTQTVNDGETLASDFSAPMPDSVRLKMSWSSNDKVLTVAFKNTDIDGDEDPWQVLTTYGVDGGKGDLTDIVWRMGRRGQFLVYLYGYTENMAVESGEMTLDEFSATVE